MPRSRPSQWPILTVPLWWCKRVRTGHDHVSPPPAGADPADAVLRLGTDLRPAAALARRPGAGLGGRGAGSVGDRLSAPEIPPRCAAAGTLRAVDRGGGARRSRRIDPHQAAGARPDRGETAGDRGARRAGPGHCPGDRRSGGDSCRGQEQHRHRLRRDDGGAVGPVDPQFLARHPVDPAVLGRIGLAAGLGFRQPRGKPQAEPGDADHARLRARQRDRCGDDAPHAQRHAAGARRRLCPHRARQGAQRKAGGPAPRPAQRAGAGGDARRARIRRPALGRGLDRAGIHHSRLRQIDRRRRVQPRLCGGAGRRAVHRDGLYRAESARRCRLCADQPAAARMTALGDIAVEADEGERPWRRALRRLVRRRAALAGLAVVLFFIALAVLAPLVAPYDPLATDWAAVRKAPSAAHWFGTDEIGRDVLARVIWGSRASLLAGLVSVSLAVMVGVPLGLVSGYLGGAFDGTVMRLTNAMIAIGVSQTPIFARLTRGQVLSVKHEDYVEAARALGNPHRRIVLRHILPNVVAPILVQASLAAAAAIIAEASLSFLGLGQQPPDPSWGSMLNTAKNFIPQAPWMAVWPGLAIFLLVLALNLFGDGLRDALDPRRS